MDGLSKRYAPPGTAPGTLAGRVIRGEEVLHFTLVEYGAEKCEVFYEVEVDQCRFHLATPEKTWIDVSGHASAEMLKALGQAFGLHPLALEDVFRGNQRAKVEAFDGQLFVVLNDPAWIEGRLEPRQVSIFAGENYVISFHDHGEDIFKPVRERLQVKDSRIRTRGTDYLLYALMDLVIDRKFPLLGRFSEAVEALEDEALEAPGRQTMRHIHSIRRLLFMLHRIQWAEREAVHTMLRNDLPQVTAETRTYLRDCLDHSVAVLELVETYRDMCGSLMEAYMMGASNRLNEVMRVLAVITTIFMPLSFIAGIYGMNFNPDASPFNMPELNWMFGYPTVLLAMLAIALCMIAWFRRRGWF